MAETEQDKRAREASTVGTDTNEEMVRRHDGFVKASDRPHPNPHIGGQTPAVETNQPTLDPDKEDLVGAVGRVQGVLSNALHYNAGVPQIHDHHRDEVVKALEDALKQVRKG